MEPECRVERQAPLSIISNVTKHTHKHHITITKAQNKDNIASPFNAILSKAPSRDVAVACIEHGAAGGQTWIGIELSALAWNRSVPRLLHLIECQRGCTPLKSSTVSQPFCKVLQRAAMSPWFSCMFAILALFSNSYTIWWLHRLQKAHTESYSRLRLSCLSFSLFIHCVCCCAIIILAALQLARGQTRFEPWCTGLLFCATYIATLGEVCTK